MDIRNATRADRRSGSSLQGYTNLSFKALVDLLGEPTYSDGHDKVYHEWAVVIEGVLVVIYDYKENGRTTKGYDWHIGGKGRMAVAAFNELLDYTCHETVARRA
jgi:hypothetical protein